MSSIPEQKAALRRRLGEGQARLKPAYLRDSDQRITAAVLALKEWKAAKSVFLYLSVGNEPDTHALLARAWQEGKRTAVPRCLKGGVMEAREIASMEGLTPKSFGILEPDETFPLIPPEEIDLVLAPCMAADRTLHRLGHGAGYYDRYLPQVRCPAVCLCRGVFLLEEVPVDGLDVKVDRVVTEDGVVG